MPIQDYWNDDYMTIRQGSREPGSSRVGKGGGAAVLTMKVSDDNLIRLLKNGIESAQPHSSGRIRRTAPIAHPRFPWMFLRDVDNAQGISFLEKVAADPQGYLEVPTLPYYSKYAVCELQARFEPRPYPVLPDTSIVEQTVNYYNTAGASQSRTVWTEWWRYVEWHAAPSAEWLTADKGQFLWSIPAPVTNGPGDATSFTGVIRYLLASVTWRVRWNFVPYAYVLSTNSNLTKYIGYVNQKLWEGFAPGTALLQAVNVLDVYSPPFPDVIDYAGVGAVSQEKLCDVELIIQEVQRVANVAVTPTNASHIAAGHNCAIHGFDLKPYYFEATRSKVAAPGTGRPLYDSIPYEFIFQNPDV